MQQVSEEGVADRPRPRRRPDHRNGPGKEQRQNRRGDRPLFTEFRCGPRSLGVCNREVDGVHTVLDRPTQLVAGVAEDPHHLHVLWKYERPEPLDAVLTPIRGEELEELGADPSALLVVGDGECDFRR